MLAAVVFFIVLQGPRTAAAADPGEEQHGRVQPRKVEEARAHFSNGMKLFDEGKFPQAQEEMEKAYGLAPSYKLLYNIGIVHRQLNDPAGAVQRFEAYLAQGAWEIPDARVAEVTRMISELTPLVGHVKVASKDPGVQISIDDRFMGQTPLEDPIVVNPGQHTVTAKLVGKLSASQSVSTAAGEIAAVQLDLKDAPVPTNRTYLGVIALLVVVAGGAAFYVLRRGRPQGDGAGAATNSG